MFSEIRFLWKDSRAVDIVAVLLMGTFEISFVAFMVWGIIWK